MESRVVLAVAFAAAFLTVLPAPAQAAASTPQHPIAFQRYTVTVDGQAANGWLAYPTDAPPTKLLVIAHGCCTALGYWGPSTSILNGSFRMSEYARYGAAVVAMDYRGPGHWDVWNGHRDTIAATEALKSRWPIERTIIWGASMGGEVSGMAVAARPDLFDYWVDTYGVTNLPEEFAAVAMLPWPWPSHDLGSDSWILDEAGTTPDGWTIRSPALRAAEMHGLKRAYIIHGVGDPIVPVSQGKEMFNALAREGIPASLLLVTTAEQACPKCGIQGPYGLGYDETRGAPVGPAAHGPWVDPPTRWILRDLILGSVPQDGFPAMVGVLDYSFDPPVGKADHSETYFGVPSDPQGYVHDTIDGMQVAWVAPWLAQQAVDASWVTPWAADQVTSSWLLPWVQDNADVSWVAPWAAAQAGRIDTTWVQPWVGRNTDTSWAQAWVDRQTDTSWVAPWAADATQSVSWAEPWVAKQTDTTWVAPWLGQASGTLGWVLPWVSDETGNPWLAPWAAEHGDLSWTGLPTP